MRDPETRTVVAAFTASLAAFAAIAVAVFTWESADQRDVELVNWVHRTSPDWLVELMRVVTHLGSVFLLGPLALVATLAFLHRGRRTAAVLVLLASIGSLFVDEVLKAAFRRVRPEFEDPFVQLTTYSFPSGHAFGAAATYGALALALLPLATTRRARVATVLLTLAVILLVASSRVVLGRHYLSDVVAGIAAGVALVSGLVLVLERSGRPVLRRPGHEQPERAGIDAQL